jgi:hypothetical protein
MRQAIAVMEECQHFTEWIITTLNTMQNDIDLALAEELLRLSRQLTRWIKNGLITLPSFAS